MDLKKSPRFLTVLALVFAGFGLSFQVIGVAAPRWLISQRAHAGTGAGIWDWCQDGSKNCRIPDWLQACRAFGLLGLVTLAACLGVGAFFITYKKNPRFPLIAAILAFVAAFFIMVQFSLYAENIPHHISSFRMDYRACFSLTVLACLLSSATGACFLLVNKYKQ